MKGPLSTRRENAPNAPSKTKKKFLPYIPSKRVSHPRSEVKVKLWKHAPPVQDDEATRAVGVLYAESMSFMGINADICRSPPGMCTYICFANGLHE